VPLYPQRHSPDFRVRITDREIASARFVHLFTTLDDAVREDTRAAGKCTSRCGVTEWQAHVRDALVSLAWDWETHANGQPATFRNVPPRSNLQLIAGLGYDLRAEEAQVLVWQKIESMDWQSQVISLPS